MQSKRLFAAAATIQRLALSLLLLLLPGTAWAQARDSGAVQLSPAQVLGGTISSGAVSWILIEPTFPWTSTGIGPSSNFVIGGQNQVAQDWWFYRLSTDTREYTLPPPTAESYVGDTAVLSWSNFNNTGLNAQLTVVVAERPSRAIHTLQITNPTAAAVSITAFRRVDFDLAGTMNGDSAVLTSSPDVMTVSDGAVALVYSASGAANYAVPANGLVDAFITNFANTGLPFGPGDFNGGGFQWAAQSIPAGQNLSYSSTYSGRTRLVTKLADTNDGVCDSDCSLREAIAVAASGDTINFSPLISGTITLTIAELTIDTDLTINGRGVIQVSGNDARRVFNVLANTNVVLNRLTIRNGNTGSGGGVNNSGTLMVDACTLSANQSSGTGGGAIFSGGALTILGSTFSGNSAANLGGAIRSSGGTLTVINSTFNGNAASNGGALANGGSVVTVSNSTFSGNSATALGSGLYQGGGTINLDNSIVANSFVGANCVRDVSAPGGGGTIHARNSLIEDGLTCVNGTNTNNLTGDPGLSALSGSPAYFTPNAGSVARNAGSNVLVPAGISTDQAGNARIQDGTVEIGSIEVANTPPTISNVANQATNEDTATPAIAFTVGDAETAPASLTVAGSSSNTTLVPNANIVFGGSGANRTVTITPAANLSGSSTITLTVTDGHTGTATDTFVLTVNPVNDLPTISDVANQVTDEDTATAAIAFTVGDAETAVASLTVAGSSSNTTLVPNANIVFGGSGANRTVTITPAANQSGNSTITLTVTDGQSATATDTFMLTVNPVNDLPTISDVANQVTDEDTATSAIAFTVGDIETAAGSLTVAGSSSNTTLVPNANIVFGGSGANRTVTITPAANQSGNSTITLTVTDGQSATATDTFMLTVNPVNDLPTISDVANQVTDEDTATSAIALTVGDLETALASLTVSGGSSNTTLVPNANIVFGGSGANRTVTITPAANLSGSSTITLTVTDGQSATATDTFVLTVNPVNDPPSFSAGPGQALQPGTNSAQTLVGWATAISDGDPDFNQALSFNLSNNNNALFTSQPAVASNGTLTFTPAGVSGTATVSISLTDDASAGGAAITTAVQNVSITVLAIVRLNDTGQINCYATAGSVAGTGTVSAATPDPETAGFDEQDCTRGRAAADAVGVLRKVGGSSAPGRDYSKIANDGSDLPASAVLGSAPGDWGCTRDNVTGLIWEIKTDDNGPRDKDHRYTWYDANNAVNGGNSGTFGIGSTCNNTLGNCNTTAFRDAVNAQSGGSRLCAAADWRLPSTEELQSLVRYELGMSGIDNTYFPNTFIIANDSYYWSGANYAPNSGLAWFVDFTNGGFNLSNKTSNLQVRLVRGPL